MLHHSLARGATYLLLGDAQEAAVLLIYVLVVIAITLDHKRKTERALEALRDLFSTRIRTAAQDVLTGDILILSEGGRVPADAMLLSAVNLSTDESLLTGESAPVRKQAATQVKTCRLFFWAL